MNHLDGLAGRWAELHEQLRYDYRGSDGIGPQNCGWVAAELGDLLRRNRKLPQKYVITRQPDAVAPTEWFEPLPYEGRVTWRRHVISSADGLAYDPIHPEPIPLQVYPAQSFNLPVQLRRTHWQAHELNGFR